MLSPGKFVMPHPAGRPRPAEKTGRLRFCFQPARYQTFNLHCRRSKPPLQGWGLNYHFNFRPN